MNETKARGGTIESLIDRLEPGDSILWDTPAGPLKIPATVERVTARKGGDTTVEITGPYNGSYEITTTPTLELSWDGPRGSKTYELTGLTLTTEGADA